MYIGSHDKEENACRNTHLPKPEIWRELLLTVDQLSHCIWFKEYVQNSVLRSFGLVPYIADYIRNRGKVSQPFLSGISPEWPWNIKFRYNTLVPLRSSACSPLLEPRLFLWQELWNHTFNSMKKPFWSKHFFHFFFVLKIKFLFDKKRSFE